MKIGIVCGAKLANTLAKKEMGSSQLMVDALRKLSVEAEMINFRDLQYKGTKNTVSVWASGFDLARFDLLYFRQTSPHKAYNSAIEFLREKRVVIVDGKLATGFDNSYKLRCMIKAFNKGLLTPQFYYKIEFRVNDYNLVSSVLKLAPGEKFIFKSALESKGKQLYLINSRTEFAVAIDQVKNTTSFGNMFVQEYIEAPGDYRVFVIGDKVLGVVFKKKSKNDFRSNVAVGGQMTKCQLTKEMSTLALRAAQITETEIAGVDFIEKDGKFYLLEVNRSPQFTGFMKATGIDVPQKIAEYLVANVESTKQKK